MQKSTSSLFRSQILPKAVTAVCIGFVIIVSVVITAPRSTRPNDQALASLRRSVVQLHYGGTGDNSLWMDEYRPSGHHHLLPALLVIHGGGWTHGSPEGFSNVAKQLADAGFVTFDVNYTLARRDRRGLYEQPKEIAQAANWIIHHARMLGAQPNRIGALGSSAGGNLVMRMALSGAVRDLKAVVSWSGPMDLENFAPLVAHDCHRDGCGTHWLATDLMDYVGCAPRACPAAWRTGSPVDNVRSGLPPVLLFNSSHELVPLAGTRLFEHQLQQAGDTVKLVVYPGQRHAGEYGSLALGPSIKFLHVELNATTTT